MSAESTRLRPSVAFVTVNYKNTAVTEAFLRSVAQLDGFDRCAVAIVDNEADEGSRAALALVARRYGGNVRVLHLEENLSYWPGAAFALQQLYPRIQDMPDWLVICNNDIMLPDRNWVAKLTAYEPAAHCVIAPSIVSTATGRDQNPFRRRGMGLLERLKWKTYYTHYRVASFLLVAHRLLMFLKERWYRFREPAVRRHALREERIYAPHGACVIFSKEYFQKGGYLDANFVLYGEEITVAEIAKRIGAPIFYCPELQVLHHEHAAIGRKLTPALYRMEREAFTYFSRRYLSAR